MRSVILCVCILLLSSCATQQDPNQPMQMAAYNPADYASRLPQHTNVGGEKTVIVDPKVHAWGAYNSQGNLVRGGIATAGAPQCDDRDASCHTGTGTFRMRSLGSEDCYSHIYPRPEGGGLMPYCMYFNGGQAMHGSPDNAVVEDNISHGCVRMRIPDAEWLRTQFAQVGTKVIVEAY